MKRNRIIISVLWVLSLVAISYYGGPISYGLFALVTLIPIISLIYILCVFLLFKIYQNIDGRTIICDHNAVFYFTLQNESLMDFSGVRVLFYSSFSTIYGLDDKTEYELGPNSGIKKQTKIVCHYRGEYEVGIKKVVIQDFFRLFSVTYKNKEPFRVTVKPNIVHLTGLKTADTAVITLKDSGVNMTQPDVLSREYVSGDDIRLINWKTSATQQKLMVRERTGEQKQGIAIIMDSARYSDVIEKYLPIENKILESVIALNLYFSEKGIPVTTYYEEEEMKDSLVDRDRGFEEFYDKMCGFCFREEYISERLCAEVLGRGNIYSKKAVFMVTHEWNDAYVETAAELEKNSISVVAYLITDDVDKAYELGQISKTAIMCIKTNDNLTEVL